MNHTHPVRDMNHHRKENILSLSFYAISLMALAMAIAINHGLDAFDVHGHHDEMHDGYVYCNHRIGKQGAAGTHIWEERIPSLDKYCETDEYILTVDGWTNCYILKKATDTVEGPMTRSDFDKKCKEYHVEFAEEQGYVGTSTCSEDNIPTPVKIATAFLALIMAVAVFRHGSIIERGVCRDTIQSSMALCTSINIIMATGICTIETLIPVVFCLIATFILTLLAYVIYKRHFNSLGSIIKVILSSIVFIFLSGIALFPLTILIISSLP